MPLVVKVFPMKRNATSALFAQLGRSARNTFGDPVRTAYLSDSPLTVKRYWENLTSEFDGMTYSLWTATAPDTILWLLANLPSDGIEILEDT